MSQKDQMFWPYSESLPEAAECPNVLALFRITDVQMFWPYSESLPEVLMSKYSGLIPSHCPKLLNVQMFSPYSESLPEAAERPECSGELSISSSSSSGN